MHVKDQKEKIFGIKESTLKSILNIIKIAIICFIAVYVIGNFQPYYEGVDSYVLGITAKQFSQGAYSVTNEFLEETGRWEFVPFPWVKTIHETAVPFSTGVGLPSLGAVFYLIAGDYGLFYIGPIFTILLLIIFDRIATKLFGEYVGFLAFLFVSTHYFITFWGPDFLTDISFTLFFILGCFYLIKFLKKFHEYNILIASSFFSICTFFRINGAIFLPIEIFILIGYFVYEKTVESRSRNNFIEENANYNQLKFWKLKLLKKFKIITFLIIPWLGFLLFWLSFNSYYFDDPMTNYYDVFSEKQIGESDLSFFEDGETKPIAFLIYSKFVLPYVVFISQEFFIDSYDVFDKDFIGLETLVILISVLAISFYLRDKRLELIIFTVFIIGHTLFYASIYPSKPIVNRYMISVLPLFSIILAYLIIRILRWNFFKYFTISLKINKGFKIAFVTFLILFFVVEFSFSPPIRNLDKDGFEFKNPIEFAGRYPLDLEGLTKNSIVVVTMGSWSLDYDVIPYTTVWDSRFYFSGFDPNFINDKSVELLIQILEDGEQVYVFKKPSYFSDKPFLRYLIENHNVILKEYSESFCKMELVNNKIVKTDEICISTDFEWKE